MTAAGILVTRVADMPVPGIDGSRHIACTQCDARCWLAPSSWRWLDAGHPPVCTHCAAPVIARNAALS